MAIGRLCCELHAWGWFGLSGDVLVGSVWRVRRYFGILSYLALAVLHCIVFARDLFGHCSFAPDVTLVEVWPCLGYYLVTLDSCLQLCIVLLQYNTMAC